MQRSRISSRRANRAAYSRAYWRNANPGNKRWFALVLASEWRDNRLARLRRLMARLDGLPHRWGGDLEYRLGRELRHYCELVSEQRVDERCFPEWAVKKWNMKGEPRS